MSNTSISQYESVAVRAYQDKYGNGLLSYTDASYTTLKTSGSGSVSATGGSYYDAETTGGSIQLQSTRWQNQVIKLQYTLKDDLHRENNGVLEDKRLEDSIESLAVEDNVTLSKRWLLALGISRDKLTPKNSDIYDRPNQQVANNYQAGLYFDLTDQHRLYASIARKSRLPTLKDRYSLRFATFVANPDLRAEQATHYEFGYQASPWANTKLEAAIFYSDIDDLIQRVRNAQPGLDQMQNIDQVRHQGIELSAQGYVHDGFLLGGSYTYLERENRSSNTRLTDTPRNKANLWLQWQLLSKVQVFAFVDYADNRWSSNTVQLDSFTTGNLKLSYQFMPQFILSAGVNNITDRNYQMSDGYPEAGREYFTNLRFEF